MNTTLLILFGVIIAVSANADDAAVQKYRNYAPEQLKNLSKEKLNSEVPMMYIMAAQSGLSNGSELLFAMQLNQLMYPGVSDYPSAVKAFQSDLGDSPDGKLTVWQIHQLEKRAEMQQLPQINFPDQFSSYISNEYATVEGTMILVDDKIYGPINHVKVSCVRDKGICEVEQMHLDVPNEQSWAQVYSVIEDGTDRYEIARWDQNAIESHPSGTSTNCRTTSMSFNFKTKEFYFITKNAGGDCKVLGVELDKLEKPRIGQIVDGKKIIESKFTEIKTAAFQALSSSFQNRVSMQEKSLNQSQQTSPADASHENRGSRR